jgi:hypothetical protein
MLDTWLLKNKLKSLSDIANPEQLEPFEILPLYTKQSAKILEIPYLPPKPYLYSGEEYAVAKDFSVRLHSSLKNACAVVYLQESLDIDLTTLKDVDFSILKTFLSASQWREQYSRFTTDDKEPAFYIENAIDNVAKNTSRGFSAKQQVLMGCNKSQELAYVLFSFVKQIRNLDLSKVHFTFYNDSNFALDIAKVRAFRFLYLQILDYYKLPIVSPHIHVRVQPRIFTLNEEWMNVKRQGTAVFSALTANVQSISVAPFDFRKPLQEIDSSRVSRNIINILKEESHLWYVYDPAKGSYLFETLTHDLAQSAWSILQKLLQGTYNGELEIKQVEQKRLQLFKDNKLDLIGTTVFQDKDFQKSTDTHFIDGVLS